ncbi:MAG: hypothetical protein II857_08450 [Selenomonadaceae bacterium]|nr:hypothetical protein [Selenomonadaceae bacterium]
MNVEEELKKIKLASLSRVREELLRRILLERKVQREFDRELDSADLNSVAAARNLEIMEEKCK